LKDDFVVSDNELEEEPYKNWFKQDHIVFL
jgi:hypothetical protein